MEYAVNAALKFAQLFMDGTDVRVIFRKDCINSMSSGYGNITAFLLVAEQEYVIPNVLIESHACGHFNPLPIERYPHADRNSLSNYFSALLAFSSLC